MSVRPTLNGMDTRVLTAVFVTLFAVAIGMQHGALSTQEFFDTLDDFRGAGDLGEVIDRTQDRTANTSVSGTLTSSDAVSVSANAPMTVSVTLANGTTARVGDSTLRSSGGSTVRFAGFTGTVTLEDDNLTVEGTARNVTTPALAFTYDAATTVSITGPRSDVAMDGLTGQTLTFANATGDIRAGDTSISVDDELARFEHFDGNMSVSGEAYTLRGEVFAATLGDARIGG